MTCFSTMARVHKTEPTEIEIARGKRFGQWLRGELARKGWNKTDLHEASGVSKTYIGVLANDCINNATGMYQRPSEEIIAKLANALGVSEDYAREASGWAAANRWNFLHENANSIPISRKSEPAFPVRGDEIYTFIHDLVVGTEDHICKIDRRDPRIALIDASEGIPSDVAVPILNSYITAMNRIREGIGSAPVALLPAELPHDSPTATASRPAATLPADAAASVERESPVVGKVPQGFRDFPLDVIQPAMEDAIEEAENAFMHMFKSRVAFYLGKQPGGGVHEIAPVDRPLPRPAQSDYPMKNVLRSQRAKRQSGSAGEKRDAESGGSQSV